MLAVGVSLLHQLLHDAGEFFVAVSALVVLANVVFHYVDHSIGGTQ